MTDYHSKPVFNVRVTRELADQTRKEAARRGQPIGDFVAACFAAERERMAGSAPDAGHESASDMAAAIFRRARGDQQ